MPCRVLQGPCCFPELKCPQIAVLVRTNGSSGARLEQSGPCGTAWSGPSWPRFAGGPPGTGSPAGGRRSFVTHRRPRPAVRHRTDRVTL